MARFPEQEDELYFSLEQVKTLASAIRSEVYYTFTAFDPLSVADVARGLGKSAQTVHYHVNELLSACLLVAVGERSRRSRTEKLYVHSAVVNYSRRPSEVNEEYRRELNKGFNAITRTMARERALAVQAVTDDPSLSPTLIFRHRIVRMASIEKALELRRVLETAISAMEAMNDPEGEILVHCAVYEAPSISVSRAVMKKASKKKRSSKKSQS